MYFAFVLPQSRAAFSPECRNRLKRERAMHLLQTTVSPSVFYPRGIYDGQRLLYLSHMLEFEGGSRFASFVVPLGSDLNAPIGSPGVVEVVITKTASEIIRPTYVLRLPQTLRILLYWSTFDSKTSTAMNLLQLLIRQSSNQYVNNPTSNGRAYFSPLGRKILPGTGVELWRGFFQSVRPTIGRMIVTIDTSMAAVYQGGPLIDIAMDVLNVKSTRDLILNDSNQRINLRKLQNHFKYRQIVTRTTGDRTKTIHDIVAGNASNFLLRTADQAEQEYFRAAHSITLRHPKTFGVRISGANAPFPVIVPAELCIVKPGQLYKKHLPTSATASAVTFATVAPQARMQAITGNTPGTQSCRSPIHDYGNSEYVRDAGMLVDPEPLRLKAKLLAHPCMEFRGGTQLPPDNGTWNVVKRQFKDAASMQSWAVVNFDLRRITPRLIQDVISDLMRAGRASGRPMFSSLTNQSLHSVRQQMGGEIDLILVLLPKSAEDIRNRVKNHFYLMMRQCGIRTSCLREDKLQRANNQYYNNVTLKLNSILGKTYAVPKTIVLAGLATQPFMCFGADVSHPAPGSSRPSIASLVFSWDDAAARYIALSEVQHPRLEMIQGLEGMVKKAILIFAEKNPYKSFFFRDGVSEGEMGTVKDQEISAVQRAFQEIWKAKNVQLPLPKVTFICVVKRHHAIFLPGDDRVNDRKTGNCRAGLVVDELRSPLARDFYLQAHGAIQGTSRSGHYSILHDENFSDDLSKFVVKTVSFYLCHVYAKATRSISLPAPVYCIPVYSP
ncbi:ribonuclease H-like domain-containing protein [Mycena polygramma]|nr:ribonuclease H-like domain-containing protein [Mycena polygramma]